MIVNSTRTREKPAVVCPGWSADRDFLGRQGGANRNRKLAADLHPLFNPLGPSAQLQNERVGTQLDDQRLRWGILGNGRVRGCRALQ